jgi:hypothetical protein
MPQTGPTFTASSKAAAINDPWYIDGLGDAFGANWSPVAGVSRPSNQLWPVGVYVPRDIDGNDLIGTIDATP